MGFENKAGLGVNNHYGVRETGGGVGLEHGEGSTFIVRIDLTGQSINDAIGGFVPPVSIPKGSKFRRAALRIDEAFVVTGTTPTLQVGAFGSVATNGVVATEAELETVGTKELTSAGAGTWAFSSTVGTAAAAKIGFALGGTGGPAVAATSGKGTLILEYINVTKV